MILEPSAEVLGASSPLVTGVGRTPSILWASAAATAVCAITASLVVEPAWRIVPPLRRSASEAIETPSASSSFSATSPAKTISAKPVPE